MAEYKLVQKLYPGVNPWKEIFYDGQVEVVDNTVVVTKEHWRDELIAWRGFEEVSLEDASSPDTEDATKKTTRRSGGRKKTAPSTSAPEERTQGDA